MDELQKELVRNTEDAWLRYVCYQNIERGFNGDESHALYREYQSLYCECKMQGLENQVKRPYSYSDECEAL